MAGPIRAYLPALLAGQQQAPVPAAPDVTTLTTTTTTSTEPPPPRPPNAWILYRSAKLKDMAPPAPGEPRRAQADVSRMLSRMWRAESNVVRSYYERLADEKKAEHAVKYPNYRFQPMKKEDKALLREQRKQEKESERKNRLQLRGRQPQQMLQPPPQQPVATPSSMPQFISSSIPYPQHYYPHLYPPMAPGSVYYPLEFFGEAGPSPPLSVASSPNPDSSPQSTASSDEIHDSQSNASLAPPPQRDLVSTAPLARLPYPLTASSTPSSQPQMNGSTSRNPYMTYFSGNSGQIMYPAQPSIMVPMAAPSAAPPPVLAPTPSAIQNLTAQSNDCVSKPSPQIPSTPALAESSQVDQDRVSPQPFLSSHPDTGTVDNTRLAGFDGTGPYMSPMNTFESVGYGHFAPPEPSSLTFDADQDFFDAMQALSGPEGIAATHMDAMFLANDIFALSNFNPDILTSYPEGELEITMGQYPQYNDNEFDTFINSGMLDTPSTTASRTYNQEPEQAAPTPNENELELPFTTSSFLDMLAANLPGGNESDYSPSTTSHPSMPPTPAGLQAALSIDLSNTETSQKATSSYVPPSGAGLASTRRVGGSWKPPPFISDGSVDHPSPRAVGVSST